jgi:hypothetical protein
MDTLKDVAAKYAVAPFKVAQTLTAVAQSYIKTGGNFGWPNPPYLTGNLYRRFGSFNTPGNIMKKIGKGYKLTLNYAPDGATYGYFAETGTGTHTAKGPRPFAKNAANSTEVKKTIEEYQRSIFLGVSEEINNEVGLIFAKLGNKK